MKASQSTLTPEQFALGEKSWLFQNVSPHVVHQLMQMGSIHTFEKEELIYSPTCFQERIGLLLEGIASVEKGGGSVLLHTLSAGSWFGVATLFSQSKRYVSVVRAKKDCTVLFYTASDVTQMFSAEPVIGKNYISFLSSRIHFLNRKIDQFTAVSAEEKLSLYLLEQLSCSNPIHLSVPYSILAEMLNLSRSSLYRALEKLEDMQIIKKEGKKIVVLKPDALEQWDTLSMKEE